MRYQAVLTYKSNKWSMTPIFSAHNSEEAECIAECYAKEEFGEIDSVRVLPQVELIKANN